MAMEADALVVDAPAPASRMDCVDVAVAAASPAAPFAAPPAAPPTAQQQQQQAQQAQHVLPTKEWGHQHLQAGRPRPYCGRIDALPPIA
jgi:hypothetical protein